MKKIARTLDEFLPRIADADIDPALKWAAIVDHLRPRRATDVACAAARLRELTEHLGRHPELRERMQASLARLFRERAQVSLYASSGLLPSTGFFSEMGRRISNRLLPEVIDTDYLKDMLSAIFPRRDDEVWVTGIDDEVWLAFLGVLLAEQQPMDETDASDLPHGVTEILESLRVLSYHIAAIGLDPELVRIDPNLEEHESPFLAQNAELLTYIGHYTSWWSTPGALIEDERHLTVMLDQCSEVLNRVRRRSMKLGTSLTLTFKLERLQQHLARMIKLLALLNGLRRRRVLIDIAPGLVSLFKELVRAECRKNNLSDYLGKNVELLSLRMTESASKTGEHYITSTRSEYFMMFASAALGGAIIALMSALKILIGNQGFAPLNETLAICLNYGLGFVLIHILGGTVATKQPAMTANAIAASIGEASGKTRDLDSLADIVVRTVRSQIAAILGNIGLAIPVAILVGLAIHEATGAHFVPPYKAQELLGEIHPLSAAPVYAAIAGVCLFLSGLIAGYYDNLSAYKRIPERLLQLQWPRRLLGERRMRAVAAYVENNLGALAGNFFFGFLLGGTTALGVLFGLPLDIRHIAFSSAYFGYANTALDFGLPWEYALLTFGGVILIGIVNLTISFSLTLTMAMRARRISFAQSRTLFRILGMRLLTRPLEFLMPPLLGSRAPAPAPTKEANGKGATQTAPASKPERTDARPAAEQKAASAATEKQVPGGNGERKPRPGGQ
ncbi:MAG: site-specific recombinase [Thauera phenolivorans]|uniref:Site-specific recombinase n=1 Tax=Thauera phenolivorans TaxID=1792543 RepID=A0A7X7LVW1_9RHOO|nr:site-specific recombinase [Thauera phenolivorans]